MTVFYNSLISTLVLFTLLSKEEFLVPLFANKDKSQNQLRRCFIISLKYISIE
jgi:hypothetical protein